MTATIPDDVSVEMTSLDEAVTVLGETYATPPSMSVDRPPAPS